MPTISDVTFIRVCSRTLVCTIVMTGNRKTGNKCNMLWACTGNSRKMTCSFFLSLLYLLSHRMNLVLWQRFRTSCVNGAVRAELNRKPTSNLDFMPFLKDANYFSAMLLSHSLLRRINIILCILGDKSYKKPEVYTFLVRTKALCLRSNWIVTTEGFRYTGTQDVIWWVIFLSGLKKSV